MVVSAQALALEARKWAQRDGEDDYAWEARLDEGVTAAALALLCAAKTLGWGSGEPVIDATERIHRIARGHGEFFRYEQPRPKSRYVRKSLGTGVMRKVWDRDGWECQECGIHRDLTVDHITPVIRGGSDEMDNLQTLCKSCNSRKGARV